MMVNFNAISTMCDDDYKGLKYDITQQASCDVPATLSRKEVMKSQC